VAPLASCSAEYQQRVAGVVLLVSIRRSEVAARVIAYRGVFERA